ncbi:adenylate cyclase [Desulfosarcina ovata subsp. ovata]|uniref:Adenylate cyclase n=1 Tax=Desulfosarcina ovata subsp. ovata TaxID=2752305 RepID=A0A5K8A5B6_9BACT|nr:adenylate cyclase [Desulfosarcina ovata subsp. ovata]
MTESLFRSMGEGTRLRLRRFAWVMGAGIFVGVVYGSLIGFAGWGELLVGGMIGAVHGFIITSVIALMEIFGVRTAWGQHIEQAPLIITILIKGVVYSTVILCVELFSVGEMVVIGGVDDPQTTRAFAPMSIIFSFIIMFIIIFFLQISRLVGGRTLRNLLLGRYHQPRMEERFFLFVDIVGSTRIAEEIGELSIHRFLNRIFALIADPVTDQHGEIYQYVGDEIVITWQIAQGRPEARPLACYFQIQSALAEASPWFEATFGVTPAVRGALHAGPVVLGEVGVYRRSIVFHGDVMNVTSRIEQATRELDSRFLASGTALDLLDGRDAYAIQDRGRRQLRGRHAPLQIFAVSSKNGNQTTDASA